MTGSFRFLLFALIAVFAAGTPAFADSDRVSVGNDIIVADGSTAHDLVCIFCSVRVKGDVKGDVVALLGSVSVESGRSIAGDLVTVGGDVNLADGAAVNGDVSVVAGELDSRGDAVVQGDRFVQPGRGWLLLPFAPLMIFIGLIWLAVWLVQRSRYRFPMYPQGRGF